MGLTEVGLALAFGAVICLLLGDDPGAPEGSFLTVFLWLAFFGSTILTLLSIALFTAAFLVSIDFMGLEKLVLVNLWDKAARVGLIALFCFLSLVGYLLMIAFQSVMKRAQGQLPRFLKRGQQDKPSC
jgi:hypothetical protein